MGAITPADVMITPLKRISVAGGDVMHALRADDPTFAGFGEAYFSWVEPGAVKAWKLHRETTLNLVVPVGLVQFVFYGADEQSGPRVEEIGERRYVRLTVPCGLIFGFQGISPASSLVLSIGDRPHDPDELRRFPSTHLPFAWR